MTLVLDHFRAWFERTGQRLSRLSDTVDAKLLFLTLLVGTLSGLGAVGLSKLIQFVH